MATERQIKANAGYVQVEGFADAGEGYCCGSCKALSLGVVLDGHDRLVSSHRNDGKDGYCTGLNVPVRTYGCCNNWRLTAADLIRV